MAHDVRSPHIFVDGPGHTASGDQVMDNFDAVWAALDGLVAPATIRISGGATPETGWLLCDGAAVSRTTYSALYTKIGDAFGPGDGSTTFNLPDLRGRSPVGAGTGSGLTARTRGAKIGSEDIKAHSHSLGFSLSVAGDASGGVVPNYYVTNTGTSTGSTGGGTDNLHPSQVVNFFIKT